MKSGSANVMYVTLEPPYRHITIKGTGQLKQNVDSVQPEVYFEA